jgi:hypothetical protein
MRFSPNDPCIFPHIFVLSSFSLLMMEKIPRRLCAYGHNCHLWKKMQNRQRPRARTFRGMPGQLSNSIPPAAEPANYQSGSAHSRSVDDVCLHPKFKTLMTMIYGGGERPRPWCPAG